jgi:thioredoxin
MDVTTPMDVTTESFERDVLERSHELPVVVDFWAAWCGPCRMLGPVLEREAESRAGEFELVKVDVDANQELALRYQIQGIPAVKAFRDGQVVREFVGALPPGAVAQFLDELTGPTAAERLVAELKESGELPEVVSALEQDEHERALELLSEEISAADEERRERLLALTVALFGDLGHEHPLTVRYRRQLAATLY